MTNTVRSLTISGDFTGFEFYDLIFMKLREAGIAVTGQYGGYGPKAEVTVFVENPHEAARTLSHLDSSRFRVRVTDDPEHAQDRETTNDAKTCVA